jgi:hypothetical protein
MQKLTLRKKAVHNKIMMHRRMYEEKRKLNFISIKNLDLSQYNDEIEQLISLESGEDKMLYMTMYLENNIGTVDIFSNLFFSTENIKLNDLSQYYLIYILSLLDKKIMKEFFPNTIIKKNNVIIDEDHPLIMSKKLFEILFSILFNVKIKEVQYTVIELLFKYSEVSDNFIEYCLEDKRYIKKIFDLTYINNNEIIYDSLFMLDNILNDGKCSNKQLEEIIQNCPIVERCKELLTNNTFNNDVKINALEILLTITGKIEKKYFKDYFIDFIQIFYNLLTLNTNNERILLLILKICEDITNDDNICIRIKESGLANLFFQYLATPNCEREFLIILLKIFSNLLYINDIIVYYLQYSKIIDVFIIIINTYMHTSNEKDNKLLYELLFCLSNLVSGPPETQYKISQTKLPELIIQIMKQKPNNDIYFEGVHFFNNILTDCNKETFHIISELHPFKIYAKGLEITNLIDNLEIALNAILNLIKKNRAVYNTIENLKKEFYTCLIKKKLFTLTNHKNKTISELAEEILNIFEDKMNTE